METSPRPVKSDALLRLRSVIDFSLVIDVGVNKKTGDLISVFPDKKHILFEPVTTFHKAMRENYKDLEYEIRSVALSDTSGKLYLKVTSVNENGRPTHSQITPNRVDVDGKKIISCEEIRVARFDSLDIKYEPDYLLKVDVDGKDKEVLVGFGKHLRQAAAIVIECTFKTILERMELCYDKGFQLFDIVDLFYYGPGLYQCDLVFVRKDLVTEELRPKISPFKKEMWQAFKC